MAGEGREPERFRRMARRARRDRERSRVAVSILRADSVVAQALERALGRVDLTLPQFNILMELAASGDAALPLYEINRRLVSTPPNTSWLATKMEQRGLVAKSKDARDSRVVILSITEHGWETLEAAAALVAGAERNLLADYTREELSVLARLLGRLLAGPESPRAG